MGIRTVLCISITIWLPRAVYHIFFWMIQISKTMSTWNSYAITSLKTKILLFSFGCNGSRHRFEEKIPYKEREVRWNGVWCETGAFPWRAGRVTRDWPVCKTACATYHCFTPNAVHLTSLRAPKSPVKTDLSILNFLFSYQTVWQKYSFDSWNWVKSRSVQ